MSKTYEQFVQKQKLAQQITEEIAYYESYAYTLYKQIERNQDLYIQGYTNSLQMNTKLVKEREKCLNKISKLTERRNRILVEAEQYRKCLY